MLTTTLNEAWHTVTPKVEADKLRLNAVKQPAPCGDDSMASWSRISLDSLFLQCKHRTWKLVVSLSFPLLSSLFLCFVFQLSQGHSFRPESDGQHFLECRVLTGSLTTVLATSRPPSLAHGWGRVSLAPFYR